MKTMNLPFIVYLPKRVRKCKEDAFCLVVGCIFSLLRKREGYSYCDTFEKGRQSDPEASFEFKDLKNKDIRSILIFEDKLIQVRTTNSREDPSFREVKWTNFLKYVNRKGKQSFARFGNVYRACFVNIKN